MIIDMFPHIIPAKYKEALLKVAPPNFYLKESIFERTPMITDLDLRFRLMDRYEGLVHVLTLGKPPIEEIVSPEKAADLARIANDGMAELVVKYPDRFIAAAAALPMNNMDAALREVDRAVKDLKFKGIQIHTPINDKPLDSPEFMPLYEKMAGYNLPIWIHPMRTPDYPDYRTEKKAKYGAYSLFGWPFETTLAMVRLVFSGVLEKWPNLQFITHHCGGMVPFFSGRIIEGYGKQQMVMGDKHEAITRPPVEYFQKFYADTALWGCTHGLMCGFAFFGADKIVFGTDMPLGDREQGARNTGLTIEAVNQMEISDADKEKIFSGNAKKLLRMASGQA